MHCLFHFSSLGITIKGISVLSWGLRFVKLPFQVYSCKDSFSRCILILFFLLITEWYPLDETAISLQFHSHTESPFHITLNKQHFPVHNVPRQPCASVFCFFTIHQIPPLISLSVCEDSAPCFILLCMRTPQIVSLQ